MRNHYRLLTTLAVLIVTAGILPVTHANFLSVTLPGESRSDGWTGLTAANYPGYGSFPGAGPWPSPIGSNTPGSGDAEFDKTGGNGYPATNSVYTFGGGSFRAFDSLALPGVSTVVFQIQIGSGDGGLAFSAAPTLSINGGSLALAPDFSQLVTSYDDTSPGFGGVSVSFLAYQWDLASLGTVTSFDVNWTTTSSAQIFALQLDQGSMMSQVVAVPEPGTYAIAAGLVVLLAWRVRRRTVR